MCYDAGLFAMCVRSCVHIPKQNNVLSIHAQATVQHVLNIPNALEKQLFCNFNVIAFSLLIKQCKLLQYER